MVVNFGLIIYIVTPLDFLSSSSFFVYKLYRINYIFNLKVKVNFLEYSRLTGFSILYFLFRTILRDYSKFDVPGIEWNLFFFCSYRICYYFEALIRSLVGRNFRPTYGTLPSQYRDEFR